MFFLQFKSLNIFLHVPKTLHGTEYMFVKTVEKKWLKGGKASPSQDAVLPVRFREHGGSQGYKGRHAVALLKEQE